MSTQLPEMQDLLLRNSYNPDDADALLAGGMGPKELERRLSEKGGLGAIGLKKVTKAWRIDRVVDRGPSHYYRFHVEGENFYCARGTYGRHISWDVPSIEGSAYDLSNAVSEHLGAPAPNPVCPRCLGLTPGKPGGTPDEPHPGPFTDELCAPCEQANLLALEREGRHDDARCIRKSLGSRGAIIDDVVGE